MELNKRFLKEFIKENEIEMENELDREQLRCLITSYCILNDISVDTLNWDILIDSLYLELGNTDWTRDQFDNFMAEHLI